MIIAAIDIGSNAARLLICEAKKYKDGTVDYTKLTFLRIPLRLGFDVFSTGRISDEKTKYLIESMAAYKLLMDIYKVEVYRACATSAMRDAKNGTSIIKSVKAKTGLNIEVIHGDEEANILYQSHLAEQLSANKAYLYVDVGGGSTEVTLYYKKKVILKESFNIGTIRLLNQNVTPDQWEHLKNQLKKYCSKVPQVEVVGSGGNINKVFSLSKQKEGKPIKLSLLKNYLNALKKMTVAERMHEYNLREDRADVIVPALEIYTSILNWCGVQEIYVPKIGLADGLVRQLYTLKQGQVNAVK